MRNELEFDWHEEVAPRRPDEPRVLSIELIAYMFDALAAASAAADAILAQKEAAAALRRMLEELSAVHRIMTEELHPGFTGARAGMEEDFGNWSADLLESPWERVDLLPLEPPEPGWRNIIRLWEKPGT